MALRGRPLTVELRAAPEVLKPASEVSESSALRLDSGSVWICWPVRLVEIAGDVDCTTVADSPTTVMFSDSVPTCITTFTDAGSAALTVTELSVVVRKPASSTITE